MSRAFVEIELFKFTHQVEEDDEKHVTYVAAPNIEKAIALYKVINKNQSFYIDHIKRLGPVFYK